MTKSAGAVLVLFLVSPPLTAGDVDTLAGKRVLFLGDSITQAGGYVAFTTYYLQKLNPQKDFDVLGLGRASESEPFARPRG